LRKCYDRLRGIEGYHNLFVNTREAQDLLRAETLLVICDVNNYKQFESPALAAAAHRVVIIDHHRKTEEFKAQPELSYIEPSASSACELTTELLEQILPTGALEKEEADIILSGILLDTKQFSRNTGVRTFGAALFLRNEGANPVDTQELFKTDLEGLRREARFEASVELYRGMAAIASDETDAGGGDSEARIAAARAADKFLTIERVQAAFVLVRIGDAVHISARSAGEVNVQLILERLGGGGYFDAAATRLDGSVAEAKERLIGAIDAYLNEQ
jgi:c-di-AMP phosphodiesterase-like protein